MDDMSEAERAVRNRLSIGRWGTPSRRHVHWQAGGRRQNAPTPP